MGLSGKVKGSHEGWGLGLLLVFFLDDDSNNNDKDDDDHIDTKKKKLTTPPPCFKSSSSNPTSTSNNKKLLITKAQSTISICALIIFFTFLLFTLSTFEPSINSSQNPSQIHLSFPRRWLIEKTHNNKKRSSSSSSSGFALQGMGTLFRRGTRAMNDLIVAHLSEDITDDELQLFLRTLHRSSITSRSDVVFIFPSSLNNSPNFSSIIHQENESFLKLIHHYRKPNNDSIVKLKMNSKMKMINGFDFTQFAKSDKQRGEPIWGKWNLSSSNSEEDELNELSWGSVVGFEAAELEPEDSLSGFFNDPPPIRLRRWACYPMLLGRVRRNFKHIMLIDVKDVVVLGDSLSRVRNRNAESVYLWISKNSDRTQSHNRKDQSKPITADVIMGGMRGIRRLSNTMLTEIVRDTIKHKNKNSVSDSDILGQLVHNESLLKNIEIGVTITESPIPETSEIVNTRKSSLKNHNNLVVVHRGGNRNLDLNSILRKEICSSLSTLNSLVYRDC